MAAHKAREINGLQYLAEVTGGAWPREEAAKLLRLQDVTINPLVRACYGMCYLMICVINGPIAGLVAGWGSHLALDLGTARSLPLI